jgi:acyl carrier protein
MDVASELRAIIGRRVKGDIRPESTLVDAGLDSIDIIEVGFDIEDRFKIQLPQITNEMISLSYADLCRFIEQHLASVRTAPVQG